MQIRFRQSFAEIWSHERTQVPLWLPVCFGTGIATYFGLSVEPDQWWAAAALTFFVSLYIAVDLNLVRTVCVMALFAISGFAVAHAETIRAAPVSSSIVHGFVEFEGTVEKVHRKPSGSRIVVRAHPEILGSSDLGDLRLRIRVANSLQVHHENTLIGARIRLAAVVRRPPPPVMPGAFDFQRHAFFQGIDAIGYAVHPVAITREANEQVSHWKISIHRLRDAVTQRILSSSTTQARAVAAALLTGHRGHLAEQTLDNMRDAGIAHLLAISGLHIGLVAGLTFAAVRLVFAVSPRFSDTIDAKKVAAVWAMMFAALYAMLAGFTVPTQRAFIMTSIVLIGVLLDRRAVTLRGVALAALIVLVTRPQSLIEPGFQMSFAAVTALVAAYRAWHRHLERRANTRNAVVRLGRYLGGVLAASVIAGAATAPFAAYHFQHMAAFGLVANMMAVPIAAFWVMPWGILVLILMPLGLEASPLLLMEIGINAILSVAAWTASLPGAALDIHAFSVGTLTFFVVGGLWFCLWQERWRLLGLLPIAMGLIGAQIAATPDVLIDGKARLFAVLEPNYGYYVSTRRQGQFISGIWNERAGFGDRSMDVQGDTGSLARQLSCDASACVLRRNGYAISIVSRASALYEDCQSSDLLVSMVPLRKPCAVEHIDRFDFWRYGAHAIFIDRDGIQIKHVRGWRGNRPWTDHPMRKPVQRRNPSINTDDKGLSAFPGP